VDYNTTLDALRDFLEDRALAGQERAGAGATLQPDTPLLEWGVLTSLRITELLSFIHTGLGVEVGPEHVVGSNFRDLDAITRLVMSLHDNPVARV